MVVCEFGTGRWNEPLGIAKRVADVVAGNPAGSNFEPYFGDDKWTLDVNNNWWLSIAPVAPGAKQLKAELRTRYGSTISATECQALFTVLNWIFNQ